MGEVIRLLGRQAKQKGIEVPEGYRLKTTGIAVYGDKWWDWAKEKWQPVTQQTFMDTPVRLLQAVIEKIETEEFEDEHDTA